MFFASRLDSRGTMSEHDDQDPSKPAIDETLTEMRELRLSLAAETPTARPRFRRQQKTVACPEGLCLSTMPKRTGVVFPSKSHGSLSVAAAAQAWPPKRANSPPMLQFSTSSESANPSESNFLEPFTPFTPTFGPAVWSFNGDKDMVPPPRSPERPLIKSKRPSTSNGEGLSVFDATTKMPVPPSPAMDSSYLGSQSEMSSGQSDSARASIWSSYSMSHSVSTDASVSNSASESGCTDAQSLRRGSSMQRSQSDHSDAGLGLSTHAVPLMRSSTSPCISSRGLPTAVGTPGSALSARHTETSATSDSESSTLPQQPVLGSMASSSNLLQPPRTTLVPYSLGPPPTIPPRTRSRPQVRSASSQRSDRNVGAAKEEPASPLASEQQSSVPELPSISQASKQLQFESATASLEPSKAPSKASNLARRRNSRLGWLKNRNTTDDAFEESSERHSSSTDTPATRTRASSGGSSFWHSRLSRGDDQPASFLLTDSQIVRASGRTLQQIEADIAPSTTHLLLSGCRESGLVETLDRKLHAVATTLQSLDLSGTELTRLPESIGQCKALRDLNVSLGADTLAELPSWICHLTSLQVLIADDVGLSSLPADLARLSALKTLSLRSNKLTSLPTCLHKLTQLETLHVAGNPFEDSWAHIVSSMLPKEVSRESAALKTPTKTPSSGTSSSSHAFTEPSSAGSQTRFSDDSSSTSGNPSPTSTGFSSNASSPMTPFFARARQELAVKSSDRSRPVADPESPLQDKGRSDIRSTGESEGRFRLLRKVTKKASSPTIRRSQRLNVQQSRLSDVDDASMLSPTRAQDYRTLPRLSLENLKSLRHQVPLLDESALGSAWLPEAGSGSTESIRRGSFARMQSSEDDVVEELKETSGSVQNLLGYLRTLDEEAADTDGTGRRLGMDGTLSHKSSILSLGSTRSVSDFAPSRPSIFDLSLQVSSESVMEIKDDSKRRRRIVAEIISTEESYTRGLQDLVDIYVKPARLAEAGSAQPVLSPADHRLVFGNVESLLLFHSNAFLPSLKAAAASVMNEAKMAELSEEERAASTAKAAEDVAEVFTRHAAFFKMYSSYINGRNAAQSHIDSWTAGKPSSRDDSGSSMTFKTHVVVPFASELPFGNSNSQNVLSSAQRKRLRAFVKRCRDDPRHSQLNLEAYLLLPVQRIPRYELLLKDLAKSTDPERLSNVKAVKEALDQIVVVAKGLNEGKRAAERFPKRSYRGIK